ncbi:unnamed protein product [Chilo suppressalis]|uniref:C2H2-type domain-containing protein n=1 Tax=Chilo suppressalis TaxID=168631 RepID=A0ABN8B9U9_CHISP|nr:hypothetical protein evm_005060 [Chilo suppressalis]CAH0402828.1 unnamed protein product [Chilo suppressalis]
MDKCRLCRKPAVQLFETGKAGVYACFKCQPLVPEVTLADTAPEETDPLEVTLTNTDEETTNLGNKTLYCGICHKTFYKSIQLQNHLRNHRAERRFICTYCNKAFSQSNNLRAHLRIHTNERPFKCTECGKAFTQVTNLNNHVRLHTGERPYVCSEPGCNKAYAQVTNLNQHRKRHLNGRPVESSYDCTVCGEQFSQRNHMYNHRREVHGETRAATARFPCGECDATFTTERMLRAHQTQHAPETEDKVADGSLRCVFSGCGVTVSSPSAHTDHLLRAHQLRVMAAPAAARPPRRGRPPKTSKDDPLANTEYHDIKIIKEDQPQYLPKLRVQLKVQSMFE